MCISFSYSPMRYVLSHICVHALVCVYVYTCYLCTHFPALFTERAKKQRHPSSNEHT